MQFSQEICEKIVQGITEGERPLTAAMNVGVEPDLFMDWTVKLPEFKYAIQRASAAAQAKLERRAYEDGCADGKQAREELRIRDPHQHSEKMALLRAEVAARDMGLPDARAAKEKAEAERRARLDDWKQNAHLIEAGSKVVPITLKKEEAIEAESIEVNPQ